ILQAFGLAKPRSLPMSDVAINPDKFEIDAATIQAIISSKYELMARLSKRVQKFQASVSNTSAISDLARTAGQLRMDFEAIWSQRALSVDQTIAAVQQWCQQAEASGISACEEFARRLRMMTVKSAL
ncbi:MAG: DesA/ISL3 alpha bundle tail domain-containing protein, partial [Burkholderiaceae bacterium]